MTKPKFRPMPELEVEGVFRYREKNHRRIEGHQDVDGEIKLRWKGASWDSIVLPPDDALKLAHWLICAATRGKPPKDWLPKEEDD
jgi:hypothetical protein